MRSMMMIFVMAAAIVTGDRARADERASKVPTPAAAPGPLSADEQKLVGLWSVDMEATWTGVQAWAKAHPGEAADRIAKPETRAMVECVAPTKAFELRADRRWIPLPGRGESSVWRMESGVLSAADPDARGLFRQRKVVGATLVEHEGGPDSPGIIYTRRDLEATPSVKDVVGDWAIEEPSARAMAKQLDDAAAAMSPGGKPGRATQLIESLLKSRLSLFDDGTAELTSGPDAQPKAYTWRADGDVLVIEPKEAHSARTTLMLWTPKGLIGVSTDPMPVSLFWLKAGDTPTRLVPAAPKDK